MMEDIDHGALLSLFATSERQTEFWRQRAFALKAEVERLLGYKVVFDENHKPLKKDV